MWSTGLSQVLPIGECLEVVQLQEVVDEQRLNPAGLGLEQHQRAQRLDLPGYRHRGRSLAYHNEPVDAYITCVLAESEWCEVQ